MPYKPDFITIAYGTNDFKHISDINEFKKNIEDYYKKFDTMFSCPVNVLTPIWRQEANDDVINKNKFYLVSDIICSMASKYNYNLIDGLKLVPHNKEFFFDSYLHPNAEGFLCFALNLIKQIKTK